MPPRPSLTVVGRRLDPEDYRLRDFLTRAAQPHEFYEAGSPKADEVLAKAGAGGAPLPVVVDGDTVHTAATVERLAGGWGGFAPPQRAPFEPFIVCARPAGLPPAGCRAPPRRSPAPGG